MTTDPMVDQLQALLRDIDVEDAVHVLSTYQQARTLWESGQVITCRECSAELPNDDPCPAAEEDDEQHDPDQVLWEPEDGEADTRFIHVSFGLRVPNDGCDYGTDVTGRLEQLLGLLLLHPMVTAASTTGPSGSGYLGEAEDWMSGSGSPN